MLKICFCLCCCCFICFVFFLVFAFLLFSFFYFPLPLSGFWSLSLNPKWPIWSPRVRHANLRSINSEAIPEKKRLDFPWKQLAKGLHNHVTLTKDLRKITVKNAEWKYIVTSRTQVAHYILLHIMGGYQCDKAVNKNDTREVIWYHFTSEMISYHGSRVWIVQSNRL